MHKDVRFVFSALVVLALVGVAVGYFSAPPPGLVDAPVDLVVDEEDAAAGEFWQQLSRLDVRDAMQAPQVVSDGGQRVWLAWDSRTGATESTLFLARSEDGGNTFLSPRAVRLVPVQSWESKSRTGVTKRESRVWPRLAFSQGQLYLSWLQPDSDDPAQLSLRVASSADGGETFADPRILSGTAAVRPSFVGFVAHSDGRLGASWLDNRNRSQQPFSSVLGPNEDRAQDQQVFAGPDDNGICPCCTTAIGLTDDGGTLVAFRNQADGYRDIWLAFRGPEGESFGEPFPVAGARWKVDGCPHDGPSMALASDPDQGTTIHLVWMDAHTGVPRVYYARGTAGQTELDVQVLNSGSGGAQGHPSLALDESGAVHVVWDESLDWPASSSVTGAAGRPEAVRTAEPHGPADGPHEEPVADSGRAICYSVSRDGGRTFSPGVPLRPQPGVYQTRPAIVILSSHRLGFAWTELGTEGKRIVWYAENEPRTAEPGSR